MMKKCGCGGTNTGLLVLRIGVGAIFIFAGWMKVSDLSSTVSMFSMMGFSAFWAYAASFGELIGGLAVLLGTFTRVGAAILAVIMVVATVMLRKDPSMLMTPLSLLFSTLALTIAGGGRFSLMRKNCACGACSDCSACGVCAIKDTSTHPDTPSQI